ncbi:MAG: BamA/TamA family outer membrane protein [Chitinophagaceae bacterium]|nr:BamA/TamA family outer membrane protein [Chitinophagaceae bacterium]
MCKSVPYHVLILLLTVWWLSSCSTTRSIPAGDALYTGASVNITDKAASKKERKRLVSELDDLTRPLPNKKILGVPFKLMIYNMAGNPKSERSLSGWLKYKVGEPPVLLSKLNLEYNIKVLQSTLENQGYFNSSTIADTVVKNKKATATYTVATGTRYTINNIELPKDSSVLQRYITDAFSNTLLKKENPFDLAVIKAERERVDAYLKEKGFYFFDAGYIIIEADSTIGNNGVDLYVKVKPGTPDRAKKVYTINDIYIFPGYRLNAGGADTLQKNAVYFEGYYLVDRRNTYKPRMFRQTMQFLPGDVYNRKDHNQSISRLVNLGVFKFVKNRFEAVEVNDSAKLNTYYYLTSLPKRSLRADINANTKSNNLTGSAITIGWRNRNTFKGGELLSVDATAGFEVQFSGQLKGYNTYRGGLETQLSFPRFIVPFFAVNTRSGFVPKTNILLAYDILSKEKLYLMNSFRAGFGYAWKETVTKEHQFNPVAVNYVQPVYVRQEYKDSISNNPTLAKAIEKQFIIGSNYNYNYNELSSGSALSGLYFNGNLDLSGNIAGLVTGANKRQSDRKTILGAEFSQYVRVETDLRYYIPLSSKNTWANRLIIGLGYPYGNSRELPFIKQFFVGGTNSIRAFRSRSLGPGTYKDAGSKTFLPDQSGDIKLEFNSELRARLFSIVHGAVFVDAGNIWLYNDNPDKPGAQFSNRFLKELAAGVGLGLRFDISFLVLRLDVAFPIRKPWLPENERWVIEDIRFGSKAWRKDNLVYNIGIGYPF